MHTDRQLESESCLALNGAKPVRDTWLPYSHHLISDDDIDAVMGALKSDYLTEGPWITAFEGEFAKVTGAKYAVAFNSGTAALHAAYFAAGIGPGDEIITSPISFPATANAARYLGAEVKFADIESSTGNIDPKSIRWLTTKKTIAIVGVDYAGHPCEVDELQALATQYGVTFLIDATHSLGGFYRKRCVGTLAHMSTFGFHPANTITTGEGGMVTTNDEESIRKLKLFRSHGIEKEPNLMEHYEGPWYQEMQALGHNYRMTDFQAALGLSQLARLDEFLARRKEIAAKYTACMSKLEGFELLEEKDHVHPAHHLFPLLINGDAEKREHVFKAFRAENIGVQVHYIPIYKHPYYRNRYGEVWAQKCPQAERFYSREVSLPIFPAMTDKDINDVCAAAQKIARELLS